MTELKLNGMVELTEQEMMNVDGGGFSWKKFKKFVSNNTEEIAAVATVASLLAGNPGFLTVGKDTTVVIL